MSEPTYSPTGWTALYEQKWTDNAGETRKSYRRLPVVAWDPETREALIVDESAGRLIPARNAYSAFHSLEEASQIVAVLPGAGWRMAYRDKESGAVHTSPVVGFTVHADGWAHPLEVEHPCYINPVSDFDNLDGELIGPGEKPTWEHEEPGLASGEDRDAAGADDQPDHDQHDAQQHVAADELDDARHDQDHRE